MAGPYAGQRPSLPLARSATRTGARRATESKHGPSPKVNWSSSYARAPAPLEPSVPLAAPAKTSEIAAASMPNNITQASHSESAAARPRWPSTAARSFSWIATFSRAGVGHRCPCPNVEVARSYLHHPLVAADLRAWPPQGLSDRHQLVDRVYGKVAVHDRRHRQLVQGDRAPVVVQEGDIGGVAPGGNAHQRLPWRQQGPVDYPPLPVDECLGDCMEVHRIQTRRVYRNRAGGYLDRTQQRNHQVHEVTAYSGTGQQGLDRPVDGVARARHVVQPGAYPERDSLQQSRRIDVAAEFSCGKTVELVGLRVPAGTQIHREVGFGHRRRIGPTDDRRGIVDGHVARRDLHLVDAAAVHTADLGGFNGLAVQHERQPL